MCGCAGHQDVVAFCTCDCPSHANRIKLRATPKHRADVPVDACGNFRYGCCPVCAVFTGTGRHRAESTS